MCIGISVYIMTCILGRICISDISVFDTYTCMPVCLTCVYVYMHMCILTCVSICISVLRHMYTHVYSNMCMQNFAFRLSPQHKTMSTYELMLAMFPVPKKAVSSKNIWTKLIKDLCQLDRKCGTQCCYG